MTGTRGGRTPTFPRAALGGIVTCVAAFVAGPVAALVLSRVNPAAIASQFLTGFPRCRVFRRHATWNAAALPMNDSRNGTSQRGLIFRIELREFLFVDVLDVYVLFHVFSVRWLSGIGRLESEKAFAELGGPPRRSL